jgi:hypothetical protein
MILSKVNSKSEISITYEARGNSFILRQISINVSIKVCLNVMNRLVVRFCENSVFGGSLTIFSSYALYILGTPDPMTERVSQ